MKRKLFALAAIFALVFTGCPTDDGSTTLTPTLQINNQSTKVIDQVVFQNVLFVIENADIIGTWTGNDISYGTDVRLTLDIVDNSWTAVIQVRGHEPAPGQGRWTRKGNSLTFKRKSGVLSGTATLSENTLTVQFKASNFSGNGFTFKSTSSNIQTTIKSGNSVTKDVEAGSGYIFFKVGATAYRTKDLVIIEKNKEAEFTFNDYTLVVNVISPDNTVTLGSL
jgi:hypothetical protein